jgi:hypothetical protein
MLQFRSIWEVVTWAIFNSRIFHDRSNMAVPELVDLEDFLYEEWRDERSGRKVKK